MINYERLTIFDKEFKRLFKKYRSLDKDLDILKATLELFPTGQSNNSEIVHHSDNIKIVKTRLFCRYLKGSTLRLTYAYHQIENKICFLEIYYKGDKENEDRERIKDYLKEMAVK
ncbi:MAG: hypothetical protein Q8P53_00395 [Candidatus Shapirobacteria bacterium]|nr:hypothetical protein [Candidatus Shapirobacteria bacterium]